MAMKKLMFLSLISILLASCGNSNDPLAEKKSKLDKLKKDYADLGTQIKKLEDEIAKMDTTHKDHTLVKLDSLLPGNFSHYVEVQGKVESEQNIGVSPQMPGTITQILVQKGESVSAGQTLATTDASVLQSNIAVVQSNLAFATTLFSKQDNLWKQGIGTEVQYLQAKTSKETLENQLQTLNQQLEMTKIKSPVTGTVDDVLTKIGESVAPGFPAFRVVNMTNMKVTADVAEAYAGKIKSGDPVTVTFPDRDKSIDKTISSVSRVIDPNKRSFGLEIRLSDADAEFFNPNMVAVVKVKDYESKTALVVPVNLVQNSDEGDFLFTATTDHGKTIAHKTFVKTGLSYGGQIEIKSGLKEGDQIITQGFEDLNDGQEISAGKK